MKTPYQAERRVMVLQASAAADDSFGSLLLLKSSMPSGSAPKGVLPRAGCSLQLQLDLSWPLTAFLPPVRRSATAQVTDPSPYLLLDICFAWQYCREGAIRSFTFLLALWQMTMCTGQPGWVISGVAIAKQTFTCMGVQAVMRECNEVFEELLGLRSMCWRLGRTWLDCCQHTGQRPRSITVVLSTILLMQPPHCTGPVLMHTAHMHAFMKERQQQLLARPSH